jgi:hypothetical protein
MDNGQLTMDNYQLFIINYQLISDRCWVIFKVKVLIIDKLGGKARGWPRVLEHQNLPSQLRPKKGY